MMRINIDEYECELYGTAFNTQENMYLEHTPIYLTKDIVPKNTLLYTSDLDQFVVSDGEYLYITDIYWTSKEPVSTFDKQLYDLISSGIDVLDALQVMEL
jgi:hypothetical protein